MEEIRGGLHPAVDTNRLKKKKKKKKKIASPIRKFPITCMFTPYGNSALHVRIFRICAPHGKLALHVIFGPPRKPFIT
jgi:hypothetical protein